MSIGPGHREAYYQVLNEVQTAIIDGGWARIPLYLPFWYGSAYVTLLAKFSVDNAFL